MDIWVDIILKLGWTFNINSGVYSPPPNYTDFCDSYSKRGVEGGTNLHRLFSVPLNVKRVI